MKKRQKYYKIGSFKKIFEQLKEDKQTFELYETTYTKKIKTPSTTIIFNDNGKQDFPMLSLINKIRKDAEEFLDKNPEYNKEVSPDFSRLTAPPKNITKKIDVRSAYWEYAKKLGVVKPETAMYFEKKYENKASELAKMARLKALGSLATKKHIRKFMNGECYEHDLDKQRTFNLYMWICDGIDDLMKDIYLQNEGVFFYYWDCVFTDKSISDEAVDYILKRGYNVKQNETKIETVKIADKYYLLSLYDDKSYIIKKQDEYLLKPEIF